MLTRHFAVFAIAALFAVLSSPVIAAETIIAVKEDGFHADIANALCTYLPQPCRIQLTKKPVADLLQETATAAALPDKITSKKIIYSRRYYKKGARFVRLKGSAHGKVSYKNMGGKIVGVERDTVFARFLSERFADVDIRYYDNLETARDDLENSTLNYVLASREQTWTGDNIETTGPAYTLARYFGGSAFAFRKEGGKELRKTFNAAIKALRKSGEYKKIYNKHFGKGQGAR